MVTTQEKPGWQTDYVNIPDIPAIKYINGATFHDPTWKKISSHVRQSKMQKELVPI